MVSRTRRSSRKMVGISLFKTRHARMASTNSKCPRPSDGGKRRLAFKVMDVGPPPIRSLQLCYQVQIWTKLLSALYTRTGCPARLSRTHYRALLKHCSGSQASFPHLLFPRLFHPARWMLRELGGSEAVKIGAPEHGRARGEPRGTRPTMMLITITAYRVQFVRRLRPMMQTGAGNGQLRVGGTANGKSDLSSVEWSHQRRRHVRAGH